jgi:hypothetical protein
MKIHTTKQLKFKPARYDALSIAQYLMKITIVGLNNVPILLSYERIISSLLNSPFGQLINLNQP